MADRINNTESYSFDEVANYLGGQAQNDLAVTPGQSAALADGAGVIDQALTTEPLSDLQAAAAIADAELQVATEVYQRETTSRIADIDAQLGSGAPDYGADNLQLAAERTQLTVERQDLEQTLSSQDATERALRGGDDAIGLSADVLDKIVDGRDRLADRIDQKMAELKAADLPSVRELADEVPALRDDYASMLDVGMAYQDLVDQKDKLEAGDTILFPRKHPGLPRSCLRKGSFPS